MQNIILTLTLLFIVVFNSISQVYNASSQYEVKLKEGERLVGNILKSEDELNTLFSKNIGTVELHQSKISKITKLHDGARYTEDEHVFYRNRYFFTESALMPQQGQIFIENKGFIMLGAGMGITKNISIDINTIYYPVIEDRLRYNCGLKIGHSFTENLSLALRYNVQLGAESGDFYRNYLSGYVTLGQPSKNITFGYSRVGYYEGFIYCILDERNDKKATSPVLTFGASLDINKKHNFKFEHAYMTKEGSLTLIGMGYSGRSLLLNYGIALVQFTKNNLEDELFPLPYVSFTFSLGDAW